MTTLEDFDSFLKKLNVDLPYDPAILILRIYSRALKVYALKKAFTRTVIADLFIKSPKLETTQIPYPQMNE